MRGPPLSLSLPVRLILLLLVLHAPSSCTGVSFSTKAIQGSTCLHDLESGLPMQFDRGELGELVMRSRAVHVTKHGVRFITAMQALRHGGMRGWHALQCHYATRQRGSLCSMGFLHGVGGQWDHNEVRLLPPWPLCMPLHVA